MQNLNQLAGRCVLVAALLFICVLGHARHGESERQGVFSVGPAVPFVLNGHTGASIQSKFPPALFLCPEPAAESLCLVWVDKNDGKLYLAQSEPVRSAVSSPSIVLSKKRIDLPGVDLKTLRGISAASRRNRIILLSQNSIGEVSFLVLAYGPQGKAMLRTSQWQPLQEDDQTLVSDQLPDIIGANDKFYLAMAGAIYKTTIGMDSELELERVFSNGSAGHIALFFTPSTQQTYAAYQAGDYLRVKHSGPDNGHIFTDHSAPQFERAGRITLASFNLGSAESLTALNFSASSKTLEGAVYPDFTSGREQWSLAQSSSQQLQQLLAVPLSFNTENLTSVAYTGAVGSNDELLLLPVTMALPVLSATQHR